MIEQNFELTRWEKKLLIGLSPVDQAAEVQRFRVFEGRSKFNLIESKFDRLESIEAIPHTNPTLEEALETWQANRETLDNKPIRVLVVNAPDDPESSATANKGDYPPLNLWRIGTWAKSKGAEVLLADGTVKSEEEIRQAIEEFQPDLLGVSVLSVSVKSAINLSAFAKERYGSIICWGNDHPSQNVRETLSGRPMVDVILRGDGADRWFGDLIEVMQNRRSIETANSASWRIKNGIKNTRFETYEMDDIPMVDPALISQEEYQVYVRNFRQKWGKWFPEGTVPTLTNFAKGCHWGEVRCAYCDIAELNLRAMTNFRRIWDEIGMLNQEYGVNLVYEVCDNFTSFVRPYSEIYRKFGIKTSTEESSWIQELLASRPDPLRDIKWFVYGRADDIVRPGVIEMLHELRVVRINMGLDHFDDRILLNGRSINKGSNAATNLKAVELMAQHGIQGHFSFVLGAPGETHETLETLKEGILWTIQTMDPLIATLEASALIPFKGNAVYNMLYALDPVFRERFGDSDTADIDEMTKYSVEKTCQVSYEEIDTVTKWVRRLAEKHGYVPAGVGLKVQN